MTNQIDRVDEAMREMQASHGHCLISKPSDDAQSPQVKDEIHMSCGASSLGRLVEEDEESNAKSGSCMESPSLGSAAEKLENGSDILKVPHTGHRPVGSNASSIGWHSQYSDASCVPPPLSVSSRHPTELHPEKRSRYDNGLARLELHAQHMKPISQSQPQSPQHPAVRPLGDNRRVEPPLLVARSPERTAASNRVLNTPNVCASDPQEVMHFPSHAAVRPLEMEQSSPKQSKQQHLGAWLDAGVTAAARTLRTSWNDAVRAVSSAARNVIQPLPSQSLVDRTARPSTRVSHANTGTSNPGDHGSEDPSEAPGNQSKAWGAVLVGFLVAFNTIGLIFAYGSYQIYYTFFFLEDVAAAKTSLIGSAQVFCMLALALPFRAAVNKGFFRILLHGGSAALVLSIFSTSFCTAWIDLFLAQGAFTGFAMALTFHSGVSHTMSCFPAQRRAPALSFIAAGACVGGLVYVWIMKSLLGLTNFDWTMRIIGFVCLGTLAVANALAKPPAKRTLRYQPATSPTVVAFWILVLSLLLSSTTLLAPYIYMPTYGILTLHQTGPSSMDLLLAMIAGTFLGTSVPAYLLNRDSNNLRRWILGYTAAADFISSILVFACIGATTRGAALTVSFLFSVSASGTAIGGGAIAMSLVEQRQTSASRNGNTKTAIRGVFLFGGMALMCGLGSVVTSMLVKGGDFSNAFTFIGVFLILGCGLMLVAWEIDRSGGAVDNERGLE